MLALFSLMSGYGPAGQQRRDQGTRSPHGSLNIACDNCHTFSSWKPIRSVPEFDHSKTKYPLLGMHTKVACMQCHTSPVFSNAATKCADCHADIHKRQFGANCEQCHTVKGWRVSLQATREHFNRFPLIGAHATLDCDSCHKGAAVGQFRGLSTDCYSCHSKMYQQTTTPNHKALGFPTNCISCHQSMDSWFTANFDHAKFTGFALTGAHATLECTACHVGGKYKGTSADCASCHQKDYNATTNPNHATAGIPTTCQLCHSTTAWQPATFNHNLTKFPLTGAHAKVECVSCHIGGKYTGTSTDCVSCHQKDYSATTNPNHAASGIPTTCQVCHSTSAWQPATFNHNLTKFPLTGAHTKLDCTSCHIGGKYTAIDTSCSSCHMKNYTAAKNPDHVAAVFPITCQQCHSTTAWSPATFDHNTFTAFPLTGAHVSVPCTSCHINGKYAGTPKDCASCHITDFNKTTNPNHVQLGFPTDCSVCHTTATWANATFDHSKTGFPLTGAHTSVACVTCHVNGNYTSLNPGCSTCHLAAYNSATNPDHKAAGFPLDCSICHSTSAWQPSSFNHNTTGFALTGAHVNVACTSCHVGGKYAGTPADCYSCHKSEFQTTTNPNHVAAHFPTTCQTCHTTTSWLGATFNHTWFPIYSGSHAGRWTTCADCHTNPSDYAVFSCITCHAHDKTTMDQKHSGVRNYVYNSANCYACHPTGNGG
jgi:hypothetical protein